METKVDYKTIVNSLFDYRSLDKIALNLRLDQDAKLLSSGFLSMKDLSFHSGNII